MNQQVLCLSVRHARVGWGGRIWWWGLQKISGLYYELKMNIFYITVLVFS